uniref:F-box domain-containing protein n=1 Tax=Globisporangium ultimum (strain ATCC 200006 / CBS 805.95 / DAOM BR144) TaxID=431595 RepID=K3WMD1_GLOUD
MKKQKLVHVAQVALSPAAAAPTAAAAIPKHLFKYLLNFVACVIDFKFAPDGTTSPQESIPCVALVCKAWYEVCNELDAEFHALVTEIAFETAQSDELQTIYRDLEARRGTLRELSLVMGDVDYECNGHCTLKPDFESLATFEAQNIDWERIFRACPRLSRLDLFCVPLDCNHLTKILDAASTYCPDLVSLIFPLAEIDATDEVASVGALPAISKLYEALERWHMTGSTRGLIQLSAPKYYPDNNDDMLERTREFLTAVSRFCPNIEYLDGWKATYRNSNGLTCRDMRFCAHDVWKTFCATCTKLREFNWLTAPFDDDFLNAFADHAKKNLTRMTIACGNQVTGNYYNDGDYYRPGGFQFTMECVSSMLAACPSLVELLVVFNDLITPSHRLKEEINDAFLRAVAEHCPNLKRLVINELRDAGYESPLAKVTDAGLLAIAKLPFLEQLALKQTQCSHDAILSLITDAPSRDRKRQIALRMGYSVDFQHTQPEEKLRNRRFELKLVVNTGRNYVPHEAPILRKLNALQTQVEECHPDVRVYFCKGRAKTNHVCETLEYLESVVFVSPATANVSDLTDFTNDWVI